MSGGAAKLRLGEEHRAVYDLVTGVVDWMGQHPQQGRLLAAPAESGVVPPATRHPAPGPSSHHASVPEPVRPAATTAHEPAQVH